MQLIHYSLCIYAQNGLSFQWTSKELQLSFVHDINPNTKISLCFSYHMDKDTWYKPLLKLVLSCYYAVNMFVLSLQIQCG